MALLVTALIVVAVAARDAAGSAAGAFPECDHRSPPDLPTSTTSLMQLGAASYGEKAAVQDQTCSTVGSVLHKWTVVAKLAMDVVFQAR